jgi:small ligand-binding sensory domain FIST
MPDVTLTPLRLSSPQGADGLTIHGWPEGLGAKRQKPAFILLADPFSTPVDEVLSVLADRCPGSAAIGGLAGGGHDFGENRLILNDEVYDGGLVGVALSGRIAVRMVVSQGCRPIGEPYVVTKAEQNVIHELGGVPALERLQTLFESLGGDERRIAQRALHLGIVIDEHRDRFERGDFLVRNLIGADRGSGSVAIGDQVQEGQTVQFHLRDAQSASEDLNLLLAADRSIHRAPLGALLFSCCGRGRGLFGRPHHDITTVREREGDVPIAGFFAQGEIGPVGGSNFLHGYTASLALFSEPHP